MSVQSKRDGHDVHADREESDKGVVHVVMDLCNVK